MIDALETAGATGLSLQPKRTDEPALPALLASSSPLDDGFDSMIERWLPLTYVMNNLSRGLGLADSYPFVLSPTVIRKLRFIYDTVNENRPAAADTASSAMAPRLLRVVGRAALVVTAVVTVVGFIWFLQDSRSAREI